MTEDEFFARLAETPRDWRFGGEFEFEGTSERPLIRRRDESRWFGDEASRDEVGYFTCPVCALTDPRSRLTIEVDSAAKLIGLDVGLARRISAASDGNVSTPDRASLRERLEVACGLR